MTPIMDYRDGNKEDNVMYTTNTINLLEKGFYVFIADNGVILVGKKTRTKMVIPCHMFNMATVNNILNNN